MSRLRRALSFENVLVTVVAFAALAGGTAYAAGHLGKGSVGKKQLKANSVSAAKIKKNAVTAAKLKKSAITSAQVKDGTIGAAAFDPATNPFSGVVQTTTSTGTATLNEPDFLEPVAVPLAGNTFSQQPGETIYIVGQLHYDTSGICGAGHKKIALFPVLYETPDLSQPSKPGREIAEGYLEDGAGTYSASGELPVSSFDWGSIPPPAAATSRTLTMFAGGACEPGAGSVSVSDVTLDVIGVK